MIPITTCSGWCGRVVVQVSADMYLLGLVLTWYGASVGWMSFVWRVRLWIDIGLYGVGSRDWTAWEISFRPHSLAEIFVAEPGPFDVHYFWSTGGFLVVVLVNLLFFGGFLEAIVSFFVGFLRQELQQPVSIRPICSFFVDSCKLSFSYSRIPEPGTSTARCY